MASLSPLYTEIMRDRPFAYWPADGPTDATIGEAQQRRTLWVSAAIPPERRIVIPGYHAGSDMLGDRYYIGANTTFSSHGGASGAQSWEVFILPDATQSAAILFGKGKAGDYEYSLIYNTAAPGVQLSIYTAAGADVALLQVGGPLAVGRMWHIVGCFDRATPRAAVFINGALAGETASMSGTSSNDEPTEFQMGHRHDGGGATFDGGMAHMAMYSYYLPRVRVLAHWRASQRRIPYPRHRMGA